MDDTLPQGTSMATKACLAPGLVYDVWQIPPINDKLMIPAWAYLTLAELTADRGFGQLVSCWLVHGAMMAGAHEVRLFDDSDFRRLFLPVCGAQPDHYAGLVSAYGNRRYPAKDYLEQLTAYLQRLENLFEGPDGCGTIETDRFQRIAKEMKALTLDRSSMQGVGTIAPFLYKDNTSTQGT